MLRQQLAMPYGFTLVAATLFCAVPTSLFSQDTKPEPATPSQRYVEVSRWYSEHARGESWVKIGGPYDTYREAQERSKRWSDANPKSLAITREREEKVRIPLNRPTSSRPKNEGDAITKSPNVVVDGNPKEPGQRQPTVSNDAYMSIWVEEYDAATDSWKRVPRLTLTVASDDAETFRTKLLNIRKSVRNYNAQIVGKPRYRVRSNPQVPPIVTPHIKPVDIPRAYNAPVPDSKPVNRVAGRKASGRLHIRNFYVTFHRNGTLSSYTSRRTTERPFKGNYTITGSNIRFTLGPSTFVGTITGKRLSGTRRRSDGVNDTWELTLDH